MEPDDLRVGHTYRVHVPRRDNPAEYVTGAGADLALVLLAINHSEGFDDDFELTVTAVGGMLGADPAVTGVRFVDTSHVRTPLAPHVADALGLSRDVDYVVEGVLKDATTGDAVHLPAEQSITIPARWLHPLGHS